MGVVLCWRDCKIVILMREKKSFSLVSIRTKPVLRFVLLEMKKKKWWKRRLFIFSLKILCPNYIVCFELQMEKIKRKKTGCNVPSGF